MSDLFYYAKNIAEDPTDAGAAATLANLVLKLGSDDDRKTAEDLVRPFIANGAAVFGVEPDHRFKTDAMIVWTLVGRIQEALALSREAGKAAARKEDGRE